MLPSAVRSQRTERAETVDVGTRLALDEYDVTDEYDVAVVTVGRAAAGPAETVAFSHDAMATQPLTSVTTALR